MRICGLRAIKGRRSASGLNHYKGVNMGKKKRGFWALIGLLFAVSLFSAAGCEALHDYAEELSYKRAKEPILFVKDDSVYVISGSSAIELKGAGVMDYDEDFCLEGMLSEDNRYLYYLSDVNEDDCGKLQMVETQPLSAPAKIADNVYNARLSADGSTLLYAADIKLDIGKLYRRNIGGESTLVAESVHGDYYGTSQNGEYIYYLVKEEQGQMDKYVLYMQYGAQDAVALGDLSSSNPDDMIAHVTIDADGTILYCLSTKINSVADIYIKKPGEAAVAADKGRIKETVNGAEEFFYIKEGELYYKAPGCDSVKAGKWNDNICVQPYYGMNPNHVYESRFLLDSAKDGAHSLTELLCDGSTSVIVQGNFKDYEINVGFTCLAYEQDGALYTVHKKDGQWGAPEKRCDNPKNYFFDDAGVMLYYIALDKPDDEDGAVYRLALRSGKASLIQRNVFSLWTRENIPHTLTGDYGGYRIDGRPVRLDDPAIGPCGWLDETEGGYIVMFYRQSGKEYEEDIYFTEDGKDHVLVLEGVDDFLDIWGTSELF